MALQLRPMQDEEFEAWLPLLQEEYAQELVRDYGMSADTARARAVVEIDGHRPVTHSVFVIEVDGEAVGHLWLVERRDDFEPTLSVYDIDIDEPYRGRGYGKAAMVFAEEEARRRGLTRIALHVGARNDVARNLYRSLGFEENEIAMSKLV
ncbi:MAG TPA: GNAT family N-acetyltransferase [Gaiellaceae bacterium]|nr:GNAT family N-acetyltransferase [Gaiellaceae bacterium]